jgi:hypothetical protein
VCDRLPSPHHVLPLHLKLTQVMGVHPNFAKIPEGDRQWLSVENDNQLEGRLTVLFKNIFSKSLNS